MYIVCLEGKGRKGKGKERVFLPNLSTLGETVFLIKLVHIFLPNFSPLNLFPIILLSKQEISPPSKSLSFLFLYFLESKHTLRFDNPICM